MLEYIQIMNSFYGMWQNALCTPYVSNRRKLRRSRVMEFEKTSGMFTLIQSKSANRTSFNFFHIDNSCFFFSNSGRFYYSSKNNCCFFLNRHGPFALISLDNRFFILPQTTAVKIFLSCINYLLLLPIYCQSLHISSDNYCVLFHFTHMVTFFTHTTPVFHIFAEDNCFYFSADNGWFLIIIREQLIFISSPKNSCFLTSP